MKGHFLTEMNDPALFFFTSWIPLGCFTVSTNSLPAPQEGGFVVRDHFPSLQQPPRLEVPDLTGACWNRESMMSGMGMFDDTFKYT